MKNNTVYIILAVIVCVASFLRLYKLGDIPSGLYQDETAIGYNAYSLLETGNDEYARFMPLYFQSFGDWKLPVYIYASVPSIALFGLTPFAVRLPSALFGILTVPALFFLVREIWGAKDRTYGTNETNMLALTAAGMLAINPWHLHYSRATFEVSICLFLFTAGAYLILSWFRNKNAGSFLVGTLLFIVSMYGYNLTRLLSPLLFMLCIWWGMREGMPQRKKGLMGYILPMRRIGLIEHMRSELHVEVVLTALVSIIALTPMAVSILGSGGASSASGTLIWSSAAVQAPLLEFRSYLLLLPVVINKLFFNSFVLMFWQYFRNIISYFSVDFFFIHGSTHGNHGIGLMGQFYQVEFVLILVGIVASFIVKMPMRVFLAVWAVLTILVASLTRETPHATRSFFLLVPLTIYSAVGMVTIGAWSYKHYQNKNWRMMVVPAVLVAGACYSMIWYFTAYYMYFPVSYAPSWKQADRTASMYIAQHKEDYDMVAIDPHSGFIYTSYLFYTSFPPKLFQDTVVHFPADSEGFTPVSSFDGILFASRKELDQFAGNTILYLTSDQDIWEKDSILTRVYYPKRPVVFNVGQRIVSYPVEEPAYVFVSVNP